MVQILIKKAMKHSIVSIPEKSLSNSIRYCFKSHSKELVFFFLSATNYLTETKSSISCLISDLIKLQSLVLGLIYMKLFLTIKNDLVKVQYMYEKEVTT